MKTILGVLAGLLVIIGYVPYILAILRDRHLPAGTVGKTEPSRASWIIWISLDWITLLGMYAKGAVNGQILGVITGGTMVLVLALRYGIPGWSRLDKFCLYGAILGVAVWQALGDPIFGIMISLALVFLGSVPTFVSAWKDPGKENRLAWTIFSASCVCATVAIPKWTLEDAAQPILFLTVQMIMMGILYVRPWFLENISSGNN
jgi:hypothetical protein